MHVQQLFLNDCIENASESDIIVLYGFTSEQIKIIHDGLSPQYVFTEYDNVTNYTSLIKAINEKVLEIMFSIQSGQKVILSLEEFIIMAPQLRLFPQKRITVFTNPLNLFLPLKYGQDYFARLYDNGIDLCDNNDEEVINVHRFYNVIAVETENEVMFHGECLDLSEIAQDLRNIEFYPRLDDCPLTTVQMSQQDILKQPILTLDMVGYRLQAPYVFSLERFGEFMQQIRPGESIQVIYDDVLPSTEKFAAALHQYNVSVVKVEVTVPKAYVYADQYRQEMKNILEKYWSNGTEAQYRNYSMYRQESRDGSLMDVSQEDVLADIVEQVCAAKNNRQYRDLFFVASTGAGKSLLYQLPSKLFHDHNMVTIVVTPLKALMLDQYQDMCKRKMRHVIYINSDVPYAEKQDRLEGVRQGLYSLLYISPEFLQRVFDIKQLIGDRQIALFVVDEAHCVSSWGKDFRADYGYLGNYIQRYKKKDGRFPILALTATAVYSGPLGTISEIASDLRMQHSIVYMTDVKRNNIEITIHPFSGAAGSYAKRKQEITKIRIGESINAGRKLLVYSPYKTISHNIHTDLDKELRQKVAVYTGDTFADEGQDIIRRYKSGELAAVIATKAFGMGVDIQDIHDVYHYSMPANLADYVQEIGRAGRDKSINARAICDFHPKDFGFWRTLRALGRLKKWQINLLVRKLYEKYRQNGTNTLLLPYEWFQFLEINENNKFESNRIRQALVMIEKDFYQRYKFPVLRVYPGGENAEYFARLETDSDKAKEKFLKQFSRYIEAVKDSQSSSVIRFKLKEYYEQECATAKYGPLKWEFFKGTLFKEVRLKPQIRLAIDIHGDFKQAQEAFYRAVKNIVQIYEALGTHPTLDEIKAVIRKVLLKASREEVEQKTYILTTLCTSDQIGANSYTLFTRKLDPEREEPEYVYMKTNRTPEVFLQSFLNLFDSTFDKSTSYKAFLEPPFCSNTNVTQIKLQLAYLLELLEIASYNISGGQQETIKIRVLSPDHLKNPNYENRMLNELYRRDEAEYEIIRRMVETCSTNQEYWQFIERYFLGREY